MHQFCLKTNLIDSTLSFSCVKLIEVNTSLKMFEFKFINIKNKYQKHFCKHKKKMNFQKLQYAIETFK